VSTGSTSTPICAVSCSLPNSTSTVDDAIFASRKCNESV
jgi:hypothetical protein